MIVKRRFSLKILQGVLQRIYNQHLWFGEGGQGNLAFFAQVWNWGTVVSNFPTCTVQWDKYNLCSAVKQRVPTHWWDYSTTHIFLSNNERSLRFYFNVLSYILQDRGILKTLEIQLNTE